MDNLNEALKLMTVTLATYESSTGSHWATEAHLREQISKLSDAIISQNAPKQNPDKEVG